MAANRDLSFNVAAIDRTAKSFEKIALRLEKLEGKLDKLDRKKVDVDVDVDTHRGLSRITEFTSRVGQGINSVALAMPGAFGRALGALPPQAQAVILGVFAAVVASSMFAVGALAATTLVFAFGAGLAGLGIAAAAQDKKIRKLFKDLGKDLGKDLKQAAEPFEDTLRTVAAVARNVFDSLNLDAVFDELAPAVSRFAEDVGDALEALAPALGPLTTAFTRFLDEFGPRLEPLFADIGDALTGVADVVNDNADIFAGLVVGLLKVIPVVINVIGWLARMFAFMTRNAPKVASAMLEFVKVSIRGLQFLAEVGLSSFGILINGAAALFGWVPGIGPKLKSAADKFNQFRDDVSGAFDDAVGKVEEWQESLDKLDKVIKLEGNINDLEGKLAEAKRKLKDPTLTKAQKKEIRADIRDLESKLAKAEAKLAKLKPATVKKVKGNIKDLESKLATAKAKLKDPTLTKAQKKEIRGEIKDLKEKIKKAKEKLASVKDKTVTLTINQQYGRSTGFIGPIAPPGRAHGGQVMSGRSYLVGERGPELFTPGSNGFITPNNKLDGLGGGGQFEGNLYLDSGQFLGVVRGEIAEQDRSKKTRALAGAGANR